MKFLKYIIITLAAGSTVMASASTLMKSGIPTAMHPHGVSLRQESKRHRPGFIPIAGRSHYGGGIRSHK